MVYNSISKYIKARNKYVNTPGKIIDGNGYYVVDGKLIPDDTYFQHNSMPVYEPAPRLNSDTTNIAPSIKVKKR